MLTFNEDNHCYQWNNTIVKSVTQIINEWMEISVYGTKYFTNRYTGLTIAADVFRAAGEFGTAVHLGCKVIAKDGGLDFNALHPSLVIPLGEFVRWQGDYKPSFVLIEKPLYSAKYGYAGTPDLICIIKRRLCVVDIKTGGYGLAGVQLAAYEQLYREHAKRGTLHADRYVLHLPKDGDYKLIKQDNNLDFPCFLSLLNAEKHMKGRC